MSNLLKYMLLIVAVAGAFSVGYLMWLSTGVNFAAKPKPQAVVPNKNGCSTYTVRFVKALRAEEVAARCWEN